MSEEKAKELGVTPMATWVAGALAGVEPSIMGVGPIAATKKVMEKSGLKVEDMDLIEANEAFAAQAAAHAFCWLAAANSSSCSLVSPHFSAQETQIS